jgi:LacI family transcriptional regulator
MLGIGIVDPNLDCVDTEPETGERSVLEHLASLDHRSIGYIYGTANQRLFDTRLETCLRIQRAMGLPVDERFVRRCGATMQDGYEATLALCQEIPAAELPTALIVVNDPLAQGTLAALNRCGVLVPQEMSVRSFDEWAAAYPRLQARVRRPRLRCLTGSLFPGRLSLGTKILGITRRWTVRFLVQRRGKPCRRHTPHLEITHVKQEDLQVPALSDEAAGANVVVLPAALP